MNAAGVKSVVTPGIKEDITVGETKPLDSAMASQYRSMTMRLNYVAQDRADLQFAGTEVARGTSNPTEEDWRPLKRVGRYLVGKPRMVLKYPFQQYTKGLSCMVDSDYAGCL